LPSERVSPWFVGALVLPLAVIAGFAHAEDAVLEVAGALPKRGSLKIADLQALGAVAATWTVHGEKHELRGVPLDRVLTRFGFEPGPMGKEISKHDKRKGWRMAVRATASDGFEAVLSCAEVFESMGTTRAMIVWQVDGKPLSADRGPLRLVVLSDKEPSRSIYSLRKLEVLDLRSGGTGSR